MNANQANKRAHPRPWRHRTDPHDPMMSSVVDKWGTLIAGSFICRQTNKETVASHALMVAAVNMAELLNQFGPASTGKTLLAGIIAKREGK